MLWDLDARNHEITALRICDIRFQERYAEGEIPQNTKTSGGPFLLTCSIPYVRDSLNKHPFKNTAEARLICNLQNNKKWNPYCLRRSAITYDSDYLPEYAVKKKARRSMNSRQGSRYIKSRMGGDLKRAILTQNGIALGDDDALKPKPTLSSLQIG